MNALRSLFLDSLATRYDAEKRLALAMPAIAKRSTCKDFRELIQRHFKETIGHIKKLQRVFECFATDARTTKSAIMISLLKEWDRMANAYKDSPALDDGDGSNRVQRYVGYPRQDDEHECRGDGRAHR